MAERLIPSPRAPISSATPVAHDVNRGRAAPRPRQPLGQADDRGMIIDETGNRIRDKFFKFLSEYEEDDGSKYYLNELDAMEQTESTTMNINWTHFLDGTGEYTDLSDIIIEDYYRFEPYLRQSITLFVRENKPNYILSDAGREKEKDFYISIKNFNAQIQYNLRELTTNKIGQLCTFNGTITRTSQVRPELISATFECNMCNKLMKNVMQQFKYTQPITCTNTQCGNRKLFKLDISRSKFIDWQKCRVQELSQDIPAGSMPRSIDVILRNEQCEKCKPGDNVLFTGTLIVVPSDESRRLNRGNTKLVRNGGPIGPSTNNIIGLKSIGIRELNYKLVFLANNVDKSEKDDYEDMDDEDIIDTFSADERRDILLMKETSSLYQNLTLSIAPSIYGHEEIKRGILLQLFGGVHKTTPGAYNKLRGDLNICIVGDPSTAKSQFLKFVTDMLPSKTIYTSGKASSAAGLTAAVIRDKETGEMGIEAGALMLADNGICCIDEFDKMDEIDQTAIHEAMEQQTITITKAGIHCSLNARTAILAACNPVWGRYDTSKPIRYNINMSAPIMSRFDLFFVVLDVCDEVTDYHVAKHIIQNHQFPHRAMQEENIFSIKQIRNYLRYAKTIKPKISQESKKWFIRYYRQLRQRDQTEQKAYRFTVRQLESLIRLSEGLARLHCDPVIYPKYVKEAARLLKKSIISVDTQDVPLTFDEEEVEPPAMQVEEEAKEEKDAEDAELAAVVEEKDEKEEKEEQLSINYNTYMQTANLICYLIRRKEIEAEAGISQKEIKNLVMKEKESEITDEQDMEREVKLLKFIVHRLIEVDHILIIKQESTTDDIEDRILIVHPNYDVDSKNTANLD